MTHEQEHGSGDWADALMSVDKCRLLMLDTMIPLDRYRPGIVKHLLAAWPNRPMTGAEFMQTMFKLVEDYEPHGSRREDV